MIFFQIESKIVHMKKVPILGADILVVLLAFFYDPFKHLIGDSKQKVASLGAFIARALYNSNKSKYKLHDYGNRHRA